ncbi:hypothetical protein MHYP_G00186030 [Metynnis hypsauchen]
MGPGDIQVCQAHGLEPTPSAAAPNSTWQQWKDSLISRTARAAPSESQPYQWDAQGRPICRDCRESGHIQQCSAPTARVFGFFAPSVAVGKATEEATVMMAVKKPSMVGE